MFGSIAQTARDTDYVFTVDTTIEGGATDDTKFIFYTNYNLDYKEIEDIEEFTILNKKLGI